jgi:hypothetical protein
MKKLSPASRGGEFSSGQICLVDDRHLEKV